ncbi:hypothetical protein T484DRAFT_1943619 [Baffinella frigidus]|nr:hypothetical protein T484DRAFT_1943619 [Cryptophyta sp. CCMP2293]
MAAKAPAKGAPPAGEPEEDTGESFGSWEGVRNEESLPDGKGKATYPNGDTFSGVIKNSYREGKGSYVWKELEEGKSGGVYDGEYESNKKHGKGVMKYPDTGTYDGVWKEGLRSGQGTFKYPNGDWYKGSWHQGKKSGRGTYFSHSGACWFMGTFQDGDFIDGEWKFKDSSCYKGLFKSGKPAPGEGMFVFPNGNVQKGKWVATPLEGGEEGATTVVWVAGELSVTN